MKHMAQMIISAEKAPIEMPAAAPADRLLPFPAAVEADSEDEVDIGV
jgi:hypothetical protein